MARYPLGSPWLCPPFPASCPCRIAVGPSPAPARSNGACGFSALHFPARFAPWVMGPSDWERFQPGLPRVPSCSTLSTRGPDGSVPASGAAAPSAPPSSGRRRSTGSRARRRSAGLPVRLHPERLWDGHDRGRGGSSDNPGLSRGETVAQHPDAVFAEDNGPSGRAVRIRVVTSRPPRRTVPSG